MTQTHPMPPKPGITPAEVYYVLFRRKWLILSICLFGLVTAGSILLWWPYPYVSQAQLFIRYVVDSNIATEREGEKVLSTDPGGKNIIATELQLILSHDTAVKVAESVGPTKILAKNGGGSNLLTAAAVIAEGFTADSTRSGDVILLTFRNKDPEILQQVLTQVMFAYRKTHEKVYLSGGLSEDSLQTEVDTTESRLTGTDTALQTELAKLGVTSFDDAKEQEAGRQGKIEQELDEIAADMAQNKETIDILEKKLAGNAPNTSAASATNAPPPAKVRQYQEICRTLDRLNGELEGLLGQYTRANGKVKALQAQIDQSEETRDTLEKDFPSLTQMKPMAATGAGTGGPSLEGVLFEAARRYSGLKARGNFLTNRLFEVRSNIALINGLQGKVNKLELDKGVENDEYKNLMRSLDQLKIASAVAPGQVSNIATVEEPTPPKAEKLKVFKACGGIFGGSIALAFGLAFVLEFYLKSTFSHAADVRVRLNLPYFLTIPSVNSGSWLSFVKQAKRLAPPPAVAALQAPNGNGPSLGPPANSRQMDFMADKTELQPFYETLRDRLISYFEMINLTHKPKLVAVTSCNAGAGVTTTAAGLAASLSETGDGNVLLVNMNAENGEAHHFYKGKLTHDLEEVLDGEKRGDARIQDRLYVARESSSQDALPRVLPKRFGNLVPKLKASDYDYIIFDMPAVTQVSMTLRLARFMDLVLVVLESEKTDRDVAKRAVSLLSESKTNVGVVLNKAKSYAPKRLQQEL